MKAIDTELTKFLGAEAQYYVPIYQRKYSWKKDNCLKLIDDILKVAKDNERPCHFIGSVIYLAKQDAMHASAVKEYLVIDGQQRLTTISIVLLALGDYTRAKIVDDADYNKATTSLEKLSRRYLTNEDETGDTYYKVRLNEEDFYAWMKLLENRTKPDDIKRSKIFENYGIIYKALCDSNVEPQLVYDGIKKLRLVDICLVPEDNAPVCISMLKSLNATNQLKSFKANLFSLTWAQRMPSDTEIKDTLKTLKIYSLSSSRTKTILDKLENNRRKEYVPTSEYTIEHIMPQTLSDDWKSDLGADANRIHETYVHTIGNLTLTGYNSEYQNKRFSDKVDCTDKAGNAIGYRHTPIKISSYLTTVSKWGEDEILARAEMLSDELITIWKYPKKD